MATKLELANRAIRELGGTPITQANYDNGNHNTGVILSDAVASSIRSVLFSHDWAINRKTVESTGVTTSLPDNQFAYRHDLSEETPPLVMLRELTDSAGYRITDYRREGQNIYSGYKTVYVRYSYDITDPSTFPPYLEDAIVAKLTYEVAIPISGSENRKNIALREYEKILSRAKVLAAREEPPQAFIDDSSSRFVEAHNDHTI